MTDGPPDGAPLPRTFLYVPGDRPERYEKACASGADAVILDLEDAVAPDRKATARAEVSAWARRPRSGTVPVWVRINAGTPGQADLDALGDGPDGVVVPKATVDALAEVAGRTPLVCCALVESAAGLGAVRELAASGLVTSIALGEIDLAADLGLDPGPSATELAPYRAEVVLACALAGMAPPIGPVHADLADLDGLHRSTDALRRQGFASRQAIHPRQVAVIHDALAPDAGSVAWARAVLVEAETSGAHVGSDGAMVDEAVLRRARLLLARADRGTEPTAT